MSSKVLKSALKDDILDLNKLNEEISKFDKNHSNIKLLLRRLIKICEQDELPRSILSINIIGKLLQKHPEYIGYVGKSMFSSFVKNSKDMSAMTAGRLNFMLTSVVEVYRADLDEGYRHAFVFIRQLAIILRKAYTSPKEQQSVHNWQYLQSLKLWTEFIVKYGPIHEGIDSLRHPLVNLITGAIRLSPSERWIPYRFHCISMLHELSGIRSTFGESSQDSLPAKTNFIPTLSLILEIFTLVNFNKPPTRVSKTPFDLRLLLHYSPSQKAESSCLEATLSWTLDLLCEAIALQATSPAFPDLTYPVLNAIHIFTKTCKNGKFCQPFRKLNNALNEHIKFILKERASIKTITDSGRLNNFRIRIATSLAEQCPYGKFYLAHRAERRKYLQQLAETKKKHTEQAFTESEKSDYKEEKEERKRKSKQDDYEDSESSDDSDASYDYDDGTKVVHVSSKDLKKAKEQADDDDSDDDFDIEAALKEVEPMEDDAISIATTQDQDNFEDEDLSDFDLEEYGPEKEKSKKSSSKKKKKFAKDDAALERKSKNAKKDGANKTQRVNKPKKPQTKKLKS